MTDIAFELDGQPVEATARLDQPLRDLLREELGETAVKAGCESGRCGVCTVLLDGEPVKSCLVVAAKADGSSVTTARGVGETDEGAALREAFADNWAVQCGYCTPGFLVTATAFLADTPDPDRDEVEAALEGNVCRCTGYRKLLDAVVAAARDLPGETDST